MLFPSVLPEKCNKMTEHNKSQWNLQTWEKNKTEIIPWPCSNFPASPSSAPLYHRALYMNPSFWKSSNPMTSWQGRARPLPYSRPKFMDNTPTFIIQRKVSELNFAFEFLLHIFYLQKLTFFILKIAFYAWKYLVPLFLF